MNHHIICEKTGGLGVITLNSEKTLNALTTPMIVETYQTLLQWKTDPEIACVMLQGAGEKAFCAGGDVRLLREAIVKQEDNVLAPECLEFFAEEYKLDYEIHEYPKPIIVFADGIVMGGGIGIEVGASHRVVTEKSKFAMPEITIGLYPDVGGTWFLNKMPPGFGLFVGLTGVRLNAADCLFTGLADYFLPSNFKSKLVSELQEITWSNDSISNRTTVTETLKRLASGHHAGSSPAQANEDFIARCVHVNSVEEFKKLLTNYPEKDEWLNSGIKSFLAGSPSSAKIIFEQLRRGANMSLEEVFCSELNLSAQCTLHPDFAEGVRALLVDKDQKPKWQPATLEEVTEPWVDSYFAPLNIASAREACVD